MSNRLARCGAAALSRRTEKPPVHPQPLPPFINDDPPIGSSDDVVQRVGYEVNERLELRIARGRMPGIGRHRRSRTHGVGVNCKSCGTHDRCQDGPHQVART